MDRDKIRAKNREQYYKHREKRLREGREYYLQHKAEMNVRSKAYREKHGEELRAYGREYRKQNLERLRAYDKERSPKRKEEHREYGQRPEVKKMKREYAREYRKRPKVHTKMQEYRQRPEVKAHRKEYREKTREHIREWSRKYMQTHPKMISYYKAYRRRVRQEFLTRYKLGKSCEICGWNKHPDILQFHHKERTGKLFNVANIARRTTQEKLEKEIKKCVLICPNCHRWLHFQESRKESKT